MGSASYTMCSMEVLYVHLLLSYSVGFARATFSTHDIMAIQHQIHEGEIIEIVEELIGTMDV
jgi:hypothetical protein